MRRTFRHGFLVVLFTAASLPALAAQDAAAAASSPQAKAYEAHQKAIAAGDYQAFRKTMSKSALAEIDKQNKEMGLDPKKMMEMMKAMAPADLKFTGLKVDGKKATLDATGKVAGEMNWGTIQLEQEDGQWKLVTESWTNTKK
jgi:hypothetical protein